MGQIVLGLVVLLILAIFTYILYRRRKMEPEDYTLRKILNIDYLVECVKLELTEVTRSDVIVKVDDMDYEQISKRRRQADEAIRGSVEGKPKDIKLVTALIRDIIEREVPDMKTACIVYNWQELDLLPPMIKWEVLCYKLMKNPEIGNNVIGYLNKKYGINQERIIDDGITPVRPKPCFDTTFLDIIFQSEVLTPPINWDTELNGEYIPITYNESLDILARLVFNKYKGVGIVTTLRQLKTDGFHFGTSGTTTYEIDGDYDAPYKMTNSVWVQIDTVWTHFSFLDFETEAEMMRVINQLTTVDGMSPMTEKQPAIVVDDFEGARITAVRKPVSECWACFVRKHIPRLYTREELWSKSNIKNWEIPDKLIYFQMRAKKTTMFTGGMNAGKTTVMKTAIGDCDSTNIRILEMSFELALRKLYPDRDILTMKPTDYFTSAMIQDIIKKMDGTMSICGEIAEDIVAARAIQFCLIGCPFMIASHHGMDDYGLVQGLANSMVACGEYHDQSVAISIVLDCIKHNVHSAIFGKDRVIEYISEIVRKDSVRPYPELDSLIAQAQRKYRDGNLDAVAQIMTAMFELSKEYYTRRTDRVQFDSRYLVRYDREKREYVPGEWYSDETFNKMYDAMNTTDRKAFIEFRDKYWGGATK